MLPENREQSGDHPHARRFPFDFLPPFLIFQRRTFQYSPHFPRDVAVYRYSISSGNRATVAATLHRSHRDRPTNSGEKVHIEGTTGPGGWRRVNDATRPSFTFIVAPYLSSSSLYRPVAPLARGPAPPREYLFGRWLLRAYLWDNPVDSNPVRMTPRRG